MSRRFVVPTLTILLTVLLGLTAIVVGASFLPADAQPQDPIPRFDRSSWGRWLDLNGDCFDTRQESIRSASDPEALLIRRKGNVCRVVAGSWLDPWTGVRFSGSGRKLHGDHHYVSLSEAHKAGGWRWTAGQKLAFYNDAENVVALLAKSNTSKGGADVAANRGRPKDRGYWCAFSSGVYRIKAKWALAIDPKEEIWLRQMQAGCEPDPQEEERKAKLERAAQAMAALAGEDVTLEELACAIKAAMDGEATESCIKGGSHD